MGLHFSEDFDLQRWSDGKIRGNYSNFPDAQTEDDLYAADMCAYITASGFWGAAPCSEQRPIVCEGMWRKWSFVLGFRIMNLHCITWLNYSGLITGTWTESEVRRHTVKLEFRGAVPFFLIETYICVRV